MLTLTEDYEDYEIADVTEWLEDDVDEDECTETVLSYAELYPQG